MLPQVRALQSLSGKHVPVPGLVSFDQEGAELGCPFFVCEHVEGDVPVPWAGSKLSEEHRRDIAGQFIAILGELHRLDWRGTQLASLHGGSEQRGRSR
ncbi:phosphotransferase [Bradyrhizobium sp. UFLA01-814]|uniref:phosphotransferase n=1 Tax=Bradyrhizobium sp. UFLA01-814 TaxID=3023480 RepID=UPI00398AFFC0